MKATSRAKGPAAPRSLLARSSAPARRCTGQVTLNHQGAFKTVLRSGWRPCRMCLTPSGLTLTQGDGPVLEVAANSIVGARIERVRSGLGRKEALCVEYRAAAGKHKVSRVWLTGKDIRALREKLADIAALFDLAALQRLAAHLDADAQCIVRFLWDRRHATIRELAEHTRMPSHMDILLKIREVVNPLSEELVGFPLLVFAPARRDPATDEEVLHSWWILGAGGGHGVQRPEIMVDAFDEADGFSILACLPCGEGAAVNVSFAAGAVEISAGEGLEPARVSLPEGIAPQSCRQAFRNGILELRWDRTRHPAGPMEEMEE
ncbi:MAG: hypothetical protein KAX19_09380 [Candidatus Brocadiae bacterium]|nr:hypothetical protein [Candidatus Brocadiia bacterium]